MAEKSQVVAALRATLLSRKGAATLGQCNRDYKQLEGESIPYAKLGYSSLEEFVSDIPSIKVYKDSYGEVTVDAVPTENTRHIADMVARQKSDTRKSAPRTNYQPRIPKNDSWRRPAPSNSYYKNQFYKQHNPHRSYNNNSNASYNHNYRAKSPYAAEPSKKPIIQAATIKNVKTSAPAVSMPVATPVTTPHTASATPLTTSATTHTTSVAKTAPIERNYSQLSMAARLQAASVIIPEQSNIQPSRTASSMANKASTNTNKASTNANKASTNANKALSRLSSLRDSLHTDVIPLVLPAAALHPVPTQTLTEIEPPAAPVPDAPPHNATAQEKLSWMCKKLILPEPFYKITCMHAKKSPAIYYCVVKIGNSHSASTYPDSATSEELAREMAAVRLLVTLESAGGQRLGTTEPLLALTRLAALVAAHDCGLWASTLPPRYREKYNENLPNNWQDLVESSSTFKTERGANGQLMILPNSCVVQAEPAAPESPASVPALPELQLPDAQYWNVYITSVNSTVEVWLRLIGEKYSDAYDNLQKAMEVYYAKSGDFVTSVEINNWYAIQLKEGWLRGMVIEQLDDERVLVFLSDHGDEEEVPISSLRRLAAHFTRLPTQAILCRLHNLEELGKSAEGVEMVRSHLVGQVLVGVPAPQQPTADDSIPIVLYRTVDADDVNVNDEILKDFCALAEFRIPTNLGEVVEVGCVSVDGRVWLTDPTRLRLVRDAFEMLTVAGPYQRPLPSAPAIPESDVLYAVQALNGEWLRCVVCSGVADDGTVSTHLVDSGQAMRAPLASLVPLPHFSPVLARLPYQAKAVRLGNAERAARSMVIRLRELLLNTPVLCRTQPTPPLPLAPEPHVELFVRSGPQDVIASVNNTILFEFENPKTHVKSKEDPKNNPLEALNRKKERIFSRTVSSGSLPATQQTLLLPPVALPNPKEWVDVRVTMAANPCNFIVQMARNNKQLSEMMALLQQQCPLLTAADRAPHPAHGDLYTVYYEKDASWYRVVVANVVSQDMVSVYFCDFGDLALVSAAELRRVPDGVPLARLLPPQAIKAKLYGVSPLHQDWSVEDCIRFQELTVEREFAGLVYEISSDPLNANEPLLTIDLVDTSTTVDVYLNRQLEKEQRAKLTVRPDDAS